MYLVPQFQFCWRMAQEVKFKISFSYKNQDSIHIHLHKVYMYVCKKLQL